MRQGYGLPIHAAAFIAAVANRSENFGQAAALLRAKPLGSCRMTAAAERRDQFISLAERYCKLGRLLPAVGDIDTNDIAAIAEASLILWEMSKTKSAMDALLQRPV